MQFRVPTSGKDRKESLKVHAIIRSSRYDLVTPGQPIHWVNDGWAAVCCAADCLATLLNPILCCVGCASEIGPGFWLISAGAGRRIRGPIINV